MLGSYAWLFFALGAALVYGISRVFYKRAVNAGEPYAFAILLNATGGLFALVYALPMWAIPHAWWPWFLVLLSAFLWAGGMILFSKSFKHTPVSKREPIAQTELIFVFLYGAIFLHETLTWGKLVGGLLIFIGMLIVTVHGRFIKASFGNYGVRMTIAAAAVTALASIVDKKAVSYFHPAVYNFLLYLAPGLILLLFIKKRLGSVKYLWKAKWKLLLVCGAFSATLYYCVLKAYSLADATSVFPIIKLGSLLAIVIGVLYFREERVHIMRKVMAGLLVLAGAMLIAGTSMFSFP